MVTRDDYVDNGMVYQDETIAAAVDKRKFLLKRLLEDQERFPEQWIEKTIAMRAKTMKTIQESD